MIRASAKIAEINDLELDPYQGEAYDAAIIALTMTQSTMRFIAGAWMSSPTSMA